MDAMYFGVFISFAGYAVVHGVGVSLDFTTDTPTAGNDQVTITCDFAVGVNGNLTYVHLDRLQSQVDGYKNLIRYNVKQQQLESNGIALEDRSTVTRTDSKLTLALSSVSCADTTNYKCDLTYNVHRHAKDFHIDIKRLEVLDNSGEVCGGAMSALKCSSLFVLLSLLISSIFLRL